MISLLHKYPWASYHLYTIAERNIIFKTTFNLLNELSNHLLRHPEFPPAKPEHHVLTYQLLQELLLAGLSVPAFSETQRAQLIDGVKGLVVAPVYVNGLAPVWPFEVLRMKLDVGEDLVMVSSLVSDIGIID